MGLNAVAGQMLAQTGKWTFSVQCPEANKNDFLDAEAICEATSRPSMRFVSPNTEAQQSLSILHRLRESLVRRTWHKNRL